MKNLNFWPLMIAGLLFASWGCDSSDEEPTTEKPTAAPVIKTEFDELSLSGEAQRFMVRYTIENPTEEGAVSWKCNASWLSEEERSVDGISFAVTANSDKERHTTLRLLYPGANIQTIDITQSAESDDNGDNNGDDNGDDNGDNNTEPAKPTFTTLSASAVTTTSATLSCQFGYTGSEVVSEVGFCYRPTSGSEESVTVSTTTGTKSTTLSNLKPETTYSWYFYAAIGGELYTSATKTFQTLAEAKPTDGKVYRTGWPELCVEEENSSDYYYAHHITDLTMKGNKARNYTVCYSAEHHCPVWVAAPRHSAYEGSTNRTNAYAKDPQIPSNIQYNSKETGGGCNKGHMLGSAERTASTTTNKQVFYYTNIAPQYSSGFNTGGGGWNTLEDWIDGQVCPDTTYLVIGTYFKKYTDGYGVTASPKKISFGDRSDVSCPTMFYIAVLRTKRGNTGKSVINCSSSELKCAAFVRTHSNEHKGQDVTSREMMSISDLEKLTGHQFFVNVPNAPKSSYNASDWGL